MSAYTKIAEHLSIEEALVRAVAWELRAAGLASGHRRRVPPEIVRRIRELAAVGLNARQIGEVVGYSRACCDSIMRGATHKRVA
ncbi:hypothetical protein DSM110093_02362 [Sulfitobacter sp. DSM 110093]|uniref:hypothetical protein n=1 Tax=Sulfitobacter sp. DSM 110093 TaxID=2883127 RepID=UPI001FABCCE0|nr:hypothetical protein [Sulfitobacter sp. DSM 110093]UOA32562.1 hypothetical protein DSM110093_02362 [Sulfitobacter sp. DSM 110093]